jgi:hypothetical protein
MTSFLECIKVQKNCILFIDAKNRKYCSSYCFVVKGIEKNSTKSGDICGAFHRNSLRSWVPKIENIVVVIAL